MVTVAHPISSRDAAKPELGSVERAGQSGTEPGTGRQKDDPGATGGSGVNSALGRTSNWESGRKGTGVERKKEASTG